MNIAEKSVTFAFSKKAESWTTRYSFVPTCYANCGDVLLSCKSNPESSQEGIWRHDTNANRNRFYGSDYRSSLTVSSNNDPSAIKLFKSVSLESNKKNWTAKFYSNTEYDDVNNQETDTVNGFIDKEGFKYLEVPRSKKNSTSNVVPCPPLSLIEGGAFGLGSTISQIGSSVASFFSNITYNLQAYSPQSIPPPLGIVYALINGELVSFNQAYTDTPLPDGIPSIQITSVDDSFVQITSLPWNIIDLPSADYVEYLSDFLQNPLFVVTPAEINGDSMRGPYLKMDLTIDTRDPLELHAVNVDYEFSKLDKRLTQNT